VFKKTLIIFLLPVMLIACNGSSPKSVAQKYLEAIGKMDFETARKYGTEETGKMLDMLAGFEKMIPDSMKKDKHPSIISVKTEGDHSTCTYREDGSSADQYIHLIKKDGDWKVVMTKDDMNGNSGNLNMDSGATSLDTVSTSAE